MSSRPEGDTPQKLASGEGGREGAPHCVPTPLRSAGLLLGEVSLAEEEGLEAGCPGQERGDHHLDDVWEANWDSDGELHHVSVTLSPTH